MRQRAAASLPYQSQYAEPAFRNMQNLIFLKIVGRILAFYSKLGSASYIKPYLLGGLDIDHRNQVWCIDITYIPMKKGFMYLTAIIDVYSRFIVGWSLHNSLDASHCIEVLQNAIATYGSPEIINSDQDCQFTCKAWLDACAQHP